MCEIQIKIDARKNTPFINANDIYQDGTTPMYRDADGTLWAMSGHSHMGHIGMFSGTSTDDLCEVYPIQTNFCVGHADYAYSGIRYPEGVKARGSLWPFGLYICPNTHRFFCFFHNETAWNGKGTGYDAYGLCQTPAFDLDFRHIGLMHSDDEGRNWTFDRWVLTSEEVCFTEKFNPGAGAVPGQKGDVISLGSGDFSMFADEEYIYLFYNIFRARLDADWQRDCDVYVARTRKRNDGIMGDFVKFYQGSFCEAGNLGKETKVTENMWHPRVLFLKKQGIYMMTGSLFDPTSKTTDMIRHETALRFSLDLIHWSDPHFVTHEGKPFGNHYVAAIADGTKNQPYVVEDNKLSFFLNHNGTDVVRYTAHIE